MQLYNFQEPSQLDMTQAYNMYMPAQQDYTTDLSELADLNEEEWDLMALADETEFDDMTPEMQQLFFKKVGRWFKKTARKVVPVVKKVVGGASKGLGIASKVAGAAGVNNKYLNTATSIAGKANGVVNGRLQEMYDDEELMALQEAGFDLNELEEMSPEMQDLFFKKVGNWFKKTARKVVPVVKKVVGGAAKGLGVVSKVAGAAGYSNPYLSTATSIAGKANGVVNGRLQEMYDDEELMALQEAGFDLNELEEMSPEMQDLFFKKVGNWFKKTARKVVPVVKKVVGGTAKGLGVASNVAGAVGYSNPYLRTATSIAGKANGVVNGRLQEMDEVAGYSPEALMALQAQGFDLNELFGEEAPEMEELDTEYDLTNEEMMELLEIGGYDMSELDDMTEEQQELFFKKIGKAFKKVGKKIGSGVKTAVKKVAPVVKKVGKIGGKVLSGVAKAAPFIAPIAGAIPVVGPGLAMGLKGAVMANNVKNQI